MPRSHISESWCTPGDRKVFDRAALATSVVTTAADAGDYGAQEKLLQMAHGMNAAAEFLLTPTGWKALQAHAGLAPE